MQCLTAWSWRAFRRVNWTLLPYLPESLRFPLCLLYLQLSITLPRGGQKVLVAMQMQSVSFLLFPIQEDQLQWKLSWPWLWVARSRCSGGYFPSHSWGWCKLLPPLQKKPHILSRKMWWWQFPNFLLFPPQISNCRAKLGNLLALLGFESHWIRGQPILPFLLGRQHFCSVFMLVVFLLPSHHSSIWNGVVRYPQLGRRMTMCIWA